jgi:hypothetical protein
MHAYMQMYAKYDRVTCKPNNVWTTKHPSLHAYRPATRHPAPSHNWLTYLFMMSLLTMPLAVADSRMSNIDLSLALHGPSRVTLTPWQCARQVPR